MTALPSYMARELALIDRVEADERMDDLDVQQMMLDNPEAPYFVFAEDRENQTYLRDTLPARWKERKQGEAYRGKAQPGEWFMFQISLYTCRMALEDVRLRFSALARADGGRIGATSISVINTEGKDSLGRPYAKRLDMPAGRLQTLWVCVRVPADAAGAYAGEAEILTSEIRPQKIALFLEVGGAALEDGGVSEPWRMSRLAWLNSDLAIDDEPVLPYVPIVQEGARAYRFLGRRMELSYSGLPERITCYYTGDSRIDGAGREILSSPLRFVVIYGDGREASFTWGGLSGTISGSGGTAEWESAASDGALTVKLRATLESEGFTSYRLDLDSDEPVEIRDVRLEIPYRADAAKYWVGLGRKGGQRAGGLDWKWDQTLWQDALWMGDVNAGLHVQLLGPEYRRPHPIFYYVYRPLKMPRSWDNGGRGGIQITEEGDSVRLTAYSGALTTTPGTPYGFYFNLLATPVKPIDYQAHWHARYRHAADDPEAMAKDGVTVVNVHHGNEHAPFINFPFIGHKLMKEYADSCHAKDMKVKVYYTVREMTHKQTELWAFQDMNGEIIAPGSGIGFFDVIPENKGENNWHRKYFGRDYIPAYVSTLRHGRTKLFYGAMDRTVVVNPDSRYNNYYVEDIAWLVKHAGIDGVYIDDFAPDRTVMRRVRKVLDRLKPGSMIDLHSWSHFKGNTFGGDRFAGWTNSAIVGMYNFPYLDRSMFGEGFNYNDDPDAWLIEISGLPFGVITEMLYTEPSKGNPYRGMVYGATPRGMPLSGMWRFWDAFGICDTRLLGYWNPECPVGTADPRVRASVFAGEGKALIALASWDNQETVECSLAIDWAALGIDPSGAALIAPHIENFQDSAAFGPRGTIPIPPGKGWLLEIKRPG